VDEAREGTGDGFHPQVACAARTRLGEGSWWDAEAGALWWVDILNRRVHRFRPDRPDRTPPGCGGSCAGDEHWDVGDVVACVIPARAGRVLLGLRHSLALLDPARGALETLASVAPGRPGSRLNDGKADARGRLWIGTMSREEGGASLYRFTPDDGLRVMETGLTISNGLGWDPSGRVFYLTDTPRRTIWAYDFDADAGALSHRRVFASLPDGGGTPDGLAVDAEGGVWSAQYGGGCVVRFAPDGREVARIPLPVPRVTSCAFGGPELRDLYVTTASAGASEEELDAHPAAGDLFRVRVDVPGLPLHRFGG
jgi:sugar lactone lactonase YvrE